MEDRGPVSSDYVRVNDDTDDFGTPQQLRHKRTQPYRFSNSRMVAFVGLGFTAIVAVVVIAVFALRHKGSGDDNSGGSTPPPPPPPPPVLPPTVFTNADVVWIRSGFDFIHALTVVGGPLTNLQVVGTADGLPVADVRLLLGADGDAVVTGTLRVPSGLKFSYTQVTVSGIRAADMARVAQNLLLVVMADGVSVFLHLTDLHYKALQPPQCQPADAHPYKYGKEACDSTMGVINSTLQAARQWLSESGADFIIITGDFAGHDNTDPIPLMQAVKTQLDTVFPENAGDQHIFASIGNNDVYPNYYLDESEPNAQLQTIAATFGDWLRDDWRGTFEYGGYYSASLPAVAVNAAPHRVLVLNTIMWATPHRPTPSADPMGQMEWLAAELQDARAGGYKVILTAHVTPGFSSFNAQPLMNLTYQVPFVALCQNYSDVIAANIVGHEHEDIFHVMAADPALPPALYLVGGAVSPVYHNNPGFRIFLYEPETLGILDYVDVSMNMLQYEAANWPYDFPTFQFRYSPLLAYGVHGADPVDWQTLAATLADSAFSLTDNTTYVTFLDHIWQGYPGPPLNRDVLLCSLTAVDTTQMQMCLASIGGSG